MGDVNLDNIKATLDLSSHGGDLGINSLANTLRDGVKANLGLSGGLNVNVGHISADVGLANIGAKVDLGGGVNGKFDVGLNDIRVNAPLRFEAAVKELPVIKLELALKPCRVRAPVSYEFSLKVFGIPVFRFAICGEASAVVENI